MTRALYIGGYGNGAGLASDVSWALLGQGYEDVDEMTFSEAVTNPDEVRRTALGADVFTHSAGMAAIRVEGLVQTY